MKIYFTGSLHNRDIDKKIYRRIISYLEKLGNTVKADHILYPTVEDLDRQTLTQRVGYYKDLDRWIKQSDLVVCEVSYPSTLNIGHEVSLALDKGKPVLALYQKNREPGVLLGISSEKLILMEYSENDLEKIAKIKAFEANIDKFIKPIDQEITGDPWFGDSIEKEWAKRVCEIIENKTIKLNNRYKIFKMNILLVNGDFLLTRDISSSYKYLKQYIKEKDFNNNFKINFTEIFIVNKLKKMIFYKTK